MTEDMPTDQICPVCDNGLTEPLAPRLISVGKYKGEVWVCKACASRAVESIGYAAHLLTSAIRDEANQQADAIKRAQPHDPDALPF